MFFVYSVSIFTEVLHTVECKALTKCPYRLWVSLKDWFIFFFKCSILINLLFLYVFYISYVYILVNKYWDTLSGCFTFCCSVIYVDVFSRYSVPVLFFFVSVSTVILILLCSSCFMTSSNFLLSPSLFFPQKMWNKLMCVSKLCLF